jgi:O-antigen ligase
VLIPLGLIVLASVAGLERLNPFGETADVRLKLWAAAVAIIRDHPLWGIGLDQFGRIYPDYIHPTLAATNERFTAHPHNLILDVWLRLGVLGLVAMAWLVVRLLRGAWVQRTVVQAGLAAAVVAALVHGMVDNVYFVPDLAFFFWLAVAVSEGE